MEMRPVWCYNILKYCNVMRAAVREKGFMGGLVESISLRRTVPWEVIHHITIY
jgi:hypothetical protein